VPRERLLRFLGGPVALVATLLIMNAVIYDLGLGATARGIFAGHTLLILVVTWMILAALTFVRDVRIATLKAQRRDAAVVIQRPAFAAIKIVVVVAAALTWLDNLGYNVTTLLASLGVGSIAVALALQKPLEDVFGAFTLYNQQPVRVGDFCRFGDKIGTVEEIGLRTTRVRTLADTLIAVPNAKIAGEYLENFSARSKILYNPTLRLRYDTPPATLERVLADLRAMLASHPQVAPKGLRVRFIRIGPDAHELEVFVYLATTVWSEYLEIVEDVNLRILRVVAAAGTSLALPAQSLVVDKHLPEAAE
jgi:MscS family membrane protein